MTEKVESVESLAETIVSKYVGGACLRGCTADAVAEIESWLHCHNIDPATMQPVDSQQVYNALSNAHRDIGEWCQFANYLRSESERPSHDPRCPTEAAIRVSRHVQRELGSAMVLVRNGEQPEFQEMTKEAKCQGTQQPAEKQQPAEPVVADEDRELIEDILTASGVTNTYTMDRDRFQDKLPAIIARHREKAAAADRAEIERLKLSGVSQMNEIRSLEQKLADERAAFLSFKNQSNDVLDRINRELDEVIARSNDRQQKLAASEARVRELENVVGDTMRVAASIANDLEHVRCKIPATADAERKSSPDPQQWP